MAKLRESLDVVLLGLHVANNERGKKRTTNAFEKNAGRLAVQVESGVLDPIAAEEQLSYLEAQRIYDHQGAAEVSEKTGALIERMVMSGSIDPIAAENMLDNFNVYSFETAADIAGRKN